MDVFDDLVDTLYALTKPSVVREVLRSRHGIHDASVIQQAGTEASTLMDQGLQFLEQGRLGPASVAFLPYYYAFLQFAKAIVVCRAPGSILGKQVRHGLQYNPIGPEPTSLAGDRIRVKRDGVFPLLHETLTGLKAPVGEVEMGSVYRYLVDAAAEHSFAFDHEPKEFGLVRITVARLEGEDRTLRLENAERTSQSHASSPLAVAFAAPVVLRAGQAPAAAFPSYLLYRPVLVQDHSRFAYFTPLHPHPQGLALAEELPIFLTLFHLGSLARYRPIFMRRVEDSKAVTFVRTVRRHAVLKMLLLTHEAIWNESYLIANA